MLSKSLILLVICAAIQIQSPFDVLEGRWKIEGKEQYEEWKKIEKGLVGRGFRIKDKEEIVLETLMVYQTEAGIIYEATVPNQNEGASILFVLNASMTDTVSFENPEHDFPNKIQYVPVNEDEILVIVSGGDDKGFSFKMNRER